MTTISADSSRSSFGLTKIFDACLPANLCWGQMFSSPTATSSADSRCTSPKRTAALAASSFPPPATSSCAFATANDREGRWEVPLQATPSTAAAAAAALRLAPESSGGGGDDWTVIPECRRGSLPQVLEILQHTFGFLDDPSLLQVRSVCTRWHRCMDWKFILAFKKSFREKEIDFNRNRSLSFIFGPTSGPEESLKALCEKPLAALEAAHDDDFDMVPDTWIVDQADQERIVIVVEHERKYPFVGWSKKMLLADPSPFEQATGGAHGKIASLAAAVPDIGFVWGGDWVLIDANPAPVDPPSLSFFSAKTSFTCRDRDVLGGWHYRTAFGINEPWSLHSDPLCLVRRRTWQRRTVKKESPPPTSAAAGTKK